MAKVYKIREDQLALLKEFLKSTKKVVSENLGAQELSPEAAAYYGQQNKEPQPPEQEEEKENGDGVVSKPAAAMSQGPQPAPTGNEVPMEEDEQQNNAQVGALIAQELKKLGIDPAKLKQISQQQPSPNGNQPQTGQVQQQPNGTRNPQLRQVINTPANPQPSVMGEEQPVSNQDDSIEFEDIPNEKPAAASTPETIESSGDDLFFKTTIRRDSGIYHTAGEQQAQMFGFPPGVEVNDVLGDMEVLWTVDFDIFPDQSGISKIKIEIKNITGQLKPEYMDEHDQYQHTDFAFDAKKLGFKFQVDMKLDDAVVRPKTLDVDWKAKLITVD